MGEQTERVLEYARPVPPERTGGRLSVWFGGGIAFLGVAALWAARGVPVLPRDVLVCIIVFLCLPLLLGATVSCIHGLLNGRYVRQALIGLGLTVGGLIAAVAAAVELAGGI